MSEAVRSYTNTSGRVRRRRRTPSGCLWVKALLIIGVPLVVIYVLWTTRDTWPLARFVSNEHRYLVAFSNVVEERGRIAGSRVWQAIPEGTSWNELPAALGQEAPLPEWVLRNLVSDECYCTGNDLASPENVLVATKMTHVGCLLERLHFLFPGVESDAAGGLDLRWLPEPDLYYAVRGRAFLLSPSRDVLIAALTMREDDALTADNLDALLAPRGGEQVRGRLTFALDEGAGAVLRGVSFALRVDQEEAELRWRAVLQPPWAERLEPLLRDAKPSMLALPLDGCLTVSLDLCKPAKEVWAGIGEASGLPFFSEEQYAEWTTIPEDGNPGIPWMLTTMLDQAGSRVRLSWYGIDINEMFPLPEVVGTLDIAPAVFDAFAQDMPEPPAGALPWGSLPRHDPDTGCVYVPMIGGPSLEPTVAVYGEALLLSSSRTVANRLLEASPVEASVDGRPATDGNLLVTIRPHACVASVVDVGRLLCEMDCLRGYTEESFDAASAEWLAAAARLRDVRILASCEGPELTGTLSVACSPEG